MLVRLAPLALCAFVVATDGTLIVGLLARVAAAIGASPGAAGQGITAFAIVYAVGAPVLITATRSRRPGSVLIIGLSIFAIANAATAAASSLIVFLAARACAGLAAGVVTPTAAALASSTSAAAERGRALAIVVGGASAAAVAGVPLGTTLGVYVGWRAAFAAVAALASVLAVVLARQHLRVKAVGALPADRSSLARRLPVVLTLLVTLLWSAGSFTFFSYLTIVLSATAAISGVGIAAELLLFGIAGVIGVYAAGRATDRRGSLQVTAVALSIMAVGEAGLALLAVAHPSHAGAVALTSALVMIYGLGTWAVTPPQQHRLLGLAPEQARMILSLNATALYSGVAIGGAVGGLVIGATHSAAILCLTGAAFLVLSLVVLRASRRTRGPRQSEPAAALR